MEKTADERGLKQAYYRLALRCHPDKISPDADKAAAEEVGPREERKRERERERRTSRSRRTEKAEPEEQEHGGGGGGGEEEEER